MWSARPPVVLGGEYKAQSHALSETVTQERGFGKVLEFFDRLCFVALLLSFVHAKVERECVVEDLLLKFIWQGEEQSHCFKWLSPRC